MEFLQNQHITKSERQSDSLYVSLANFLKKIHSGPKFEGNTNIFDWWIQIIMKSVKKNIEAKNLKEIPILKLEKIITLLRDTFVSDTTTAPCHNDLNPGNLMFSGDSFKAIDYELAAPGNPYYDIAEIAIFNCMSAVHENILLSTYLGHQPSEGEKAKLYLMKQAAWIFDAIFFLKINPEQIYKYKDLNVSSEENLINKMVEGKINLENPDDVLRYSKFVINHVLKNFESQEFKNASKVLQKK